MQTKHLPIRQCIYHGPFWALMKSDIGQQMHSIFGLVGGKRPGLLFCVCHLQMSSSWELGPLR